MFLDGIILGQWVRILIATGATHNIIVINFAKIRDMLERHINTAILVSNGTKITCRSASYSVPLRIDTETFHIDALLVDISNNIDVILSMPWMADIGSITWNFASLEMQFQRNSQTITFTSIQDRHPQ